MQYTAMFKPESYTETGAEAIEIKLCDYASAGYGKEKSAFQVWLPQLFSGRPASVKNSVHGTIEWMKQNPQLDTKEKTALLYAWKGNGQRSWLTPGKFGLDPSLATNRF